MLASASKLRSVATAARGVRSFSSKRPSTVKDALDFAKANKAEIVDIRFTDLHGTDHHIQFPTTQFDEDFFKHGVAFDASSIRGWQAINESDMQLLPDPSTIAMDPFTTHRTVSLVADVVDPITLKPYSRDPRHIARKAVEYLRSTGIAHDMYVGPEQEFFIFDNISFNLDPLSSHFEVYSSETMAGSHESHTGHYKIRHKEGYFPVKPWDQLQDIRSEIVLECDKLGLRVERSHHEVAAPGQGEINYRFDTVLRSAENVQTFKYVVRNVAARHGKIATFMPKPISGDNGTGMHTHVSLHLPDGKNLFSGDKYSGLSEMALHFIGGIIKHSKSLLAITNPTVNSYKRLVPGFEAPINMAYSARNRSASLRIPICPPKAKRVEFRTPDGACNPYLSFAAILMAGIDGIKHKANPGAPLEKDIYSLSKEELASVPKAPADLADAIDNLERNHKFLTEGNVFTPDLIETWIERKREHEINPSRKYITPFEFHQYFDC